MKAGTNGNGSRLSLFSLDEFTPVECEGRLFDVESQPLPMINGADTTSRGIAAETLVMADLQLSGHYAQRFECRPFDVVSYVGPTPVRVQVKGVDDKPGARSCSWCITNGPTGPNAKRKRYGPDDFDVLACVTTNSRLIGYVPASDVDFTKSTFSLPVQSMDGRYIAGYSLQRILERLGLVR